MSYTDKKEITVLTLVYSLPPFKTGGAESQALKLSKQLQKKRINTILVTIGDHNAKGWDKLDEIPVYRIYNLWDRTKNFSKVILGSLRSTTKKESATQIEFDDQTEITTAVVSLVTLATRIRYTSFFISCLLVFFKKRNEIDLIYVPSLEWPALAGLWLSKMFRKPLVVKDSTMNGITNILRYPDGRKKQKSLIAKANFIAISKAIISNLKTEGIPANKITYIPNGISIEQISRNTVPKSEVKRVLFVGNLTQQPAKGVDILLKAWKLVIGKQNNIHLDIVGDGDIHAYNSFADKLGILGTVTFYGKQNVEKFLANAYLFVLPSRREGLSNALMEAMMYGLPCIATNISGSEDLIEDKINGVLVPPINVEILAEAIVYMLDHPTEAKNMGLLARETIIGKCNFDLISDKYAKLYFELSTDKGAMTGFAKKGRQLAG